MISAPQNIYGPNVFKIFVHELGGPRCVCKMLDVAERTVWRWLAEGSVPKMAVRALYWETRYGRSLIDADHDAEVVLLRSNIQILEQQFVRATHIIQGLKSLYYGTSNEPLFDERGEFNEPNPDATISDVVTDVGDHSISPISDRGKPFLSAKEQARKAAMIARQEATAHLSAKEYAERVLTSTRRRETLEKKRAAA